MTDTPVDQSTVQITPSQASDQLEKLAGDKEWSAKLVAGDGATVRQFHELSAAKVKANQMDAVLDGSAVPQEFETVTPGNLSTRNLMSAVSWFQEGGVGSDLIRDFLSEKPISPELKAEVDRRERLLMGSKEWKDKLLAGDAEAKTLFLKLSMAKLRPVSG